jgi:Flp pilus assembly protein TadG
MAAMTLFANRHRQRGVMMIEAAIILPVFLALMIGGFELARYINLNEKLSRASVTVSDIVSRSNNLTEAQIQDVFFGVQTILSPYFGNGSDSRVIISSVTRPANQNPTVVWQRNGAGTLAAPSRVGVQGGTAVLPAGFTLANNESVIIAEIFYAFEPMFASSDLVAHRLYDRSLFRPRTANNIALAP